MKQRLFTKIFLTVGVLVVLSLTVIMMVLTVVYNSYLSKQKYENLQKSCDSIVSTFERNRINLSDFSSEKGLHFMMKNLSEVSDFDMYVTDSYGVIRICTCDTWAQIGSCEHTDTRIDKKYFENTLKEQKGRLSTIGVYKDPRYVYSSLIYANDGSVSGMVIAAAPMSAMKTLLKRIARIYIFSAILPLGLMFVALYIITYRLTRPLKMMSVAAKAMANGDFSKRIPVTSDDEIGELAASFNQMTNSLSRLESMRKSFVTDVSHELKTPMTTIGGFIDGILDGTIDKENQDHYLELVSNEIKRLSRMVESMLGASRLESDEFILKYEKFDFTELLINIVLSQEQRIESQNIDIQGLDEISNITVNADKDLIYRVIYNLVDNAIKFTDENGKISFKLSADSREINFQISNTGKGISKADLPYVFERFYKTDKSRTAAKKGTGLGLFIVKTIINKHGGKISVTSNNESLTTFRFTLPINK